ncbi:MAG: EscU/YscU/HrcU family type III secretion system export apparatus switch protein [Betaproteobacteria bacterium]|nr:EscU/YscU/HrcU family type III secretion system export apparatus switch protein [Betaproteobacteria bacterium]NCP82091.1 EscU/YscU/HrcU family type III secretion system export apparatus switch protein [Rhodoferax sp.]OIP22049.1 MAG: flagellar biosynthetic protein FlhB [Comamonadaceae bacterium CG2_30_57_122]PIZ21663.1 MAG: flagellar biosynthetic protein FlhB [Comamonadaceae bacterium CG_4_10_14_0_8_um_filter_57_29]PJC21493.1 MAG: flagellar biosynthetic protein FlhB [Comamonadaceae bacterium 
MDSSSQDRNLPASERKLQKARDDGQVARSQDLSHLAVLGGGALCLVALAPMMLEHIQNAMSWQLLFDVKVLDDPASMQSRLSSMVLVGLAASAIFGLIVSLISMLSTVATSGWVASLKPITPDFSRLNPLSGFGRMFTKDKATEVLKMSFIATMLLLVGFTYLSSGMETLGSLVLQPSAHAMSLLADWLTHGMSLMLLVVLVVAMVDVPLQNFLHKSRMKMSHQEMKQEHKESDGNPQMKGRMRQRQRDIANGNSISKVPKADFVLMNPTHYAVAIQYDEARMAAPRVISKGADLLAFRIRDLAKEHAIPVLQSPMLARALYANAELDQDIPTSLYTAVAQVLAYIYRLKAALRGDGPMPGEPPLPFVPPELDPLSKVVATTDTP